MDANNQESPNTGDRMLFFTFLFASCCCCGKLPQTPDFKPRKFTLWQFCRSESQHPLELHSSQKPGDMVCALSFSAAPSRMHSLASPPLPKPAMSDFCSSHNSFFLYKNFLDMLATPGNLRKIYVQTLTHNCNVLFTMFQRSGHQNLCGLLFRPP